MEQLKVYEFAKEIGIETLALMDKIRQWEIPVKSHMASLDEEMRKEILSRLEQEAQAAKPKKKAVRKKAATPVAKTTKVAKPKKGATRKASGAAAPGPAEAAEAAIAASGPVRQKGVIRRTPGQIEEQKAAEESALAAAAAAEAAPAEAAGVEAEVGAETPAPEPSAPARTRGKIIGRMDLSRARPPAAAISAGTAAGAAGKSPRVGAQRNLRPGFVAQPMHDLAELEEERAARAKAALQEAEDKKPKTARTEEVPTFNAADFRKREVIFQPKKKKVSVNRDPKKTQITTPKASKRIVKMYGTLKVSELAQQMNVKAPEVIKKLIAGGVMANINTDLDYDTVSLMVPEFGFEVQNLSRTVSEIESSIPFGDLAAEGVTRPPVVTVMGHVDHGKTTLLDAIRKEDVASKEAGGITQHIGAYKVKLEDGHLVTFIDTPGHEAFTSMRARGANVTDIVVLVVAADDGVMPQTEEAINHAKAAKVPIIVAVNKMDKPGANPDRIKQQMTAYELVPEEWGGTTIYCPVSALKGQGVKELLEQILVVAEVQELKSNPKRSGTGIMIESRMEKGRGNVATVLVKDGTIRQGDVFAAGTVVGRIRSMADDKGERILSAGPGEPVEIIGLPEAPAVGERFDVCVDEAAAELLAQQRRADIAVKEDAGKGPLSLDQIFAKVKKGAVQELAIVLKADVAGSAEAITQMISKLATSEVKVNVMHSGVGGVTESDVLLASAAKGVIFGFNVRPDTGAQRLAKEKGIEIKYYSIIYELVDELKKALSGLLKPDIVEESLGRAEVREIFTTPKSGTIGGCFVTDGKILRSSLLRLIRDGRQVYEGRIASLRRFKDDVREVATGFECGISIENYNDLKVGDVIEAYEKKEIARQL